MLVPLNWTKSELDSQVCRQELMSTPGALRSGLRRPSDSGPRLLKDARLLSVWVVVLLSSKAPTVIALKASPGMPTVPDPEPLFPAEIATERLRSCTIASKNSVRESL